MRFFCSNRDCRARWKNFSSRSKAPKCHACKRPATRLKRLPAGVSAYVLPDFPEHFNVSMGVVVKNRAHHKRLQRERGLQDWEPTRNSPGSQLSLGRTR